MITDAQFTSLKAVQGFASVRGCTLFFEAKDTNADSNRLWPPRYLYTTTMTANDSAWKVERQGRDMNTVLTESLRFLLTLRKSETYSRVWNLPPSEVYEDEYVWEDEI